MSDTTRYPTAITNTQFVGQHEPLGPILVGKTLQTPIEPKELCPASRTEALQGFGREIVR
jgi:hypothetical protein